MNTSGTSTGESIIFGYEAIFAPHREKLELKGLKNITRIKDSPDANCTLKGWNLFWDVYVSLIFSSMV